MPGSISTDLAEHPRALRIAPADPDPRVVAELLDAQRDTILLLVELEHLGGDFLADLQHLRRVTHATPRHVGDVQEAVDAAEVDERTVVGDVLDDAMDDRALVQRLEQLGALLALRELDHRAAREHHVVALAVELDDLELEGLALVGGGVLDRARVDQRARQERADAVRHDGQAALDLAGDGAVDVLAGLERLLQADPRGEPLGAVARQPGLAVAVFERLDRHRHEVAGLHVELAAIVVELLDRDEALGLQSGVDDDEVVVDAHHLGGDDLALAHLLARQGFLEQLGEAFGRVCSCGCSSQSGSSAFKTRRTADSCAGRTSVRAGRRAATQRSCRSPRRERRVPSAAEAMPPQSVADRIAPPSGPNGPRQRRAGWR